MTPSTEGKTGESSDRPAGGWLAFERRPLLKILGAGGSIALGSGIAAASGEESDGEAASGDESGAPDGDEAASRKIDPMFGYPAADAADVPEDLDPDHEVELHRELPDDPENPDRPTVFHFEPSGLHVNAGDVVAFVFTDPNHTVTAYHPEHGFQRRVPEGVPPFSSPIVPHEGVWLYRFEREGLYDLYCGPHEITGMAMRIVVGDLDEADVPDYEGTFEAEPPLFAPLSPEFIERELNAPSDHNEDCEWTPPTDREVLDTSALDPMNIQEAGEVSYGAVADDLDIAFEPGEHD